MFQGFNLINNGGPILNCRLFCSGIQKDHTCLLILAGSNKYNLNNGIDQVLEIEMQDFIAGFMADVFLIKGLGLHKSFLTLQEVRLALASQNN